MKNGWRVIFGIALTAVIFGAVCCGVGLLTGADINRIMLNVNEQFQVMDYVNTYLGHVQNILASLKALF